MDEYDILGRGDNNKNLSPTLSGGGMGGGNNMMLSSPSSGWMAKGVGSFGETLRGIVEGLKDYANKRIGPYGMTKAQGAALGDAGRLMGAIRGQDMSVIQSMMTARENNKNKDFLGLGDTSQPISGPSEAAEKWMIRRGGGGL